MPVVGTRITEPVSIDDINSCLQLASERRANDVGYLCSNVHGNTNKWAKYKPVNFKSSGSPNLVSRLTEQQLQSTNYGLEYHLSIKWEDVITTSWSYIPPEGTYISPYRMADFIGYNHSVSSPYLNLTGSPTWNKGLQPSFTFQFEARQNDIGGITFTDLSTSLINDYYAAIVVTNQSTGESFIKTGAKISSNGPWEIQATSNEYPWTIALYSTYRYYWIGSSTAYPSWTSASGLNSSFIDLPFVQDGNRGTLTVVPSIEYDISVNITGLSTNSDFVTTVTRTFENAELYYANETSTYYKLNNTGNYVMEISFINYNNTSAILNLDMIYMYANPTFPNVAADMRYMANQRVYAYNKTTGAVLTGTQQLPGNSTTKLYIGIPQFMLYTADGLIGTMLTNTRYQTQFRLVINTQNNTQTAVDITFGTLINLESAVYSG